MCYNISITKERTYIEKRFEAHFAEPDVFKPIYHASGFTTPYFAVITNVNPKRIQFYLWGFIPFWVKDEKSANAIRIKTLNARSETIFEKPSFKTSIMKRRCLVIVDGFYEWRDVEGKKYPYYITIQNNDVFALAGIWDTWTNKQSGESRNTFSIITTQANTLMEKIHNTKKRMPVILKKDAEQDWLREDMSPDEMKAFFEPFDDKTMSAHPVSKLISTRRAHTNIPEVMKPHEYEELENL